MIAGEHYEDGALRERWEIARAGRGVRFRRWDGAGTQVEDRDATPEEIAALAAHELEQNGDAIREQARAALAQNRAFVAAAKPVTATAQASQAYDQAKQQARQLNGLIRLLLGALDAAD